MLVLCFLKHILQTKLINIPFKNLIKKLSSSLWELFYLSGMISYKKKFRLSVIILGGFRGILVWHITLNFSRTDDFSKNEINTLGKDHPLDAHLCTIWILIQNVQCFMAAALIKFSGLRVCFGYSKTE